MNYTGIVIGLITFLTIGLFHPLVIKAEYYLGKKSWWLFLLAGIITLIASLMVENLYASIILGVVSFSSFWSILEIFEQFKRVFQGAHYKARVQKFPVSRSAVRRGGDATALTDGEHERVCTQYPEGFVHISVPVPHARSHADIRRRTLHHGAHGDGTEHPFHGRVRLVHRDLGSGERGVSEHDPARERHRQTLQQIFALFAQKGFYQLANMCITHGLCNIIAFRRPRDITVEHRGDHESLRVRLLLGIDPVARRHLIIADDDAAVHAHIFSFAARGRHAFSPPVCGGHTLPQRASAVLIASTFSFTSCTRTKRTPILAALAVHSNVAVRRVSGSPPRKDFLDAPMSSG